MFCSAHLRWFLPAQIPLIPPPPKKHKNKSRVYLQNHFFSISLFVSNPDQQHTSFRLLGRRGPWRGRAGNPRARLLSKRPLIQYKNEKVSVVFINVTSGKSPLKTHKGGREGGGVKSAGRRKEKFWLSTLLQTCLQLKNKLSLHQRNYRGALEKEAHV